MQMLGRIFYIILFIGLIGSMFTILILLAQKALRLVLPVWAGMLGAVFFIVPIVIPQVQIFSPEETLWLRGYEIASMIWIIGTGMFLLYYLLRGLFAHRAVKRYHVCEDERLLRIYSESAQRLQLKRTPPLLFGTLKDPACVVALLRPIVILNKEIALRLSDKELQIVLCHELTHVQRKHHFAGRMYDFVSVLHWFNPLVWIARHEFSYTCETDCDGHTLKALAPLATVKDYATTMLRLMELASEKGDAHFGAIGALSFLLIKQRFVSILHRPSKKKRLALIVLASFCVVCTILFSMTISRSMFYPFPAHIDEYSEQAQAAGR